jgi:4-amino-4-deoxy-L-arabinose transferase-like glycosyltransferase
MLKHLSDKTYTAWLYAFIFIHVLVWTMAPSLVRFTLPMDAQEGAIWGRQLEWGYDKNPFMNGWLTELAIRLGGQSGWMVYLFSQLSVAICFWATWQLSKKMLPPVYALASILLLEGVQYYHLHAIDFNDNTLELGLWALTILFFYQALREEKIRYWLLTGLFAGLGMMTKYFTVMLLSAMLLFMLSHHDARQAFKKPGLYAGIIVAIGVMLPHILWLFQHDFITLNYAVKRVSSPPTWFNHIFYPVQFAWQILETFFPSLILLFVLSLGKKPALPLPSIQIHSFDKRFLFFVGLGPYVLTILLSALAGMKLRAGWGQPLLTLWGIIFLIGLSPQITLAKFHRFLILVFGTMIAIAIAYCTALIQAKEPSSANFPGKNIATTLTDAWHNQYHTPLKYVVGSRWMAGNIALYSSDRPQVYMDANKKTSPWIDEKKLQQEGAIFIWDLSEDTEVPINEIQKRFSKLGKIQVLHFAWLRNNNMPPVKITFAFLAPAH